MDVVTIGDVMIDVRVDADGLEEGGDVHGRVLVRPGGSAANAAVWAAESGARARVHGRIGSDVAGALLREELIARGVEPALVMDPTADTGTMLIVHEPRERSMVADRGAGGHLSPDDLPERIDAGAVFVSGYSLLFEPTAAAGRAALDRARAKFVAVDAASWPMIRSFGVEAFFDACGPATMLLANEREAETLTGQRGEDSADALARRFPIVCVKLGEAGAVMSWERLGDPRRHRPGGGEGSDGSRGRVRRRAARQPRRRAVPRRCPGGGVPGGGQGRRELRDVARAPAFHGSVGVTGPSGTPAIHIAPEIAEAIAADGAVVALETSVVAQGLPLPRNLECVDRMSLAVRGAGAVPAWIGVSAGRVVVGLSDDELRTFAEPGAASKVARRDLPFALGVGWTGRDDRVEHDLGRAPRRDPVGATGGTGGVHPGTADVSADLLELARTPILLVCSGPKSIVDPVVHGRAVRGARRRRGRLPVRPDALLPRARGRCRARSARGRRRRGRR